MLRRFALVVLAACKQAPATPQLIDAAPDAFAVDTTITCTRDGAPDVNEPVVFQAADGTVLAIVMTDSSGVATAKLAEHATISVFQPSQISTFVDVPPGDHLTLKTFANGTSATQPVTVTIPTDPDPSVTQYFVNLGCGDLHGTQVAVPLACGATDDVLVRALSGDNGVGVLVAMDVPIVGGAMTVPGTYMPFTDETFTVTNGTGLTGNLFASIVGAHGPMGYYAATLDLRTTGSVSQTTPSLVEAGVNQHVVVTAYTGAVVQVVTSIVPTATSFTLDLGAALLPSYADPPTYDLPNHRVLWQPSGGALTPDVTFARIPISRATAFWEWHVVAPYVAGELALPALPVLDFDFNPQAGDTITVRELEQLHAPGGYDAVRANALSVIADGNVFGPFVLRIDPTAPTRDSRTGHVPRGRTRRRRVAAPAARARTCRAKTAASSARTARSNRAAASRSTSPSVRSARRLADT